MARQKISIEKSIKALELEESIIKSDISLKLNDIDNKKKRLEEITLLKSKYFQLLGIEGVFPAIKPKKREIQELSLHQKSKLDKSFFIPKR